MKKVAIVQSNYIPWKGYFDLIAAVDEFVLFDDVQYTRRDWRNRNQIKTPDGASWLTIPVKVKGKYSQKICETEIDGADWCRDHWKALQQNYKRSAYFSEVSAVLEPLYLAVAPETKMLSSLNRHFLQTLCQYLEIPTALTNSSDYKILDDRTDRLVSIVQQAGGTEYLSGPAAKGYLDEARFQAAAVDLTWFNYDGYPPYQQLWGEFTHGVSILDLLFNCGKNSPKYMRYVNR
jgi:hypothetical protein